MWSADDKDKEGADQTTEKDWLRLYDAIFEYSGFRNEGAADEP